MMADTEASVDIVLFAGARQAAGQSTISVVIPVPCSAAKLMSSVLDQYGSLGKILPSCRLAVDQEYVNEDAEIRATSELALIPPVSGG